ncbi:MAG: V-type H+-transporting ATPase subunit C [Candidatus Saganbacteria bacterium]|uniref:V-type H+-transporting ATPase subunit C n=1 Tax=Candidatus Saganbacteria bacterium TaxID=2575572 RepID=A0A833L2B9_UNCSA|nr:MAG: V-type H+-transporting ATPase subunit C [Candidatus Saganbacteria bacterium]
MVKFAYASARIRAIESKMLSEAQILRMVDSHSFEQAFNILSETSENLAKLEKPFDFEALCRLELKGVKELLDQLAPQNEIISVIWEKHEIDGEEDKNYLLKLKQTADKHNVNIFSKYAESFIVLHSLKASIKQAEVEQALAKYRYYDCFKAVNKGLSHFQKTGSLSVFEREIDNYLMEIIKEAKYFVFGIEPLIGYAIAKEIEIKNLRFVLTAKLLQVPPEQIKERVRISYV